MGFNADKHGKKLTKILQDWRELNLNEIALARHSFNLGYTEAEAEFKKQIKELKETVQAKCDALEYIG